ncbi:MAG: ThiF family adenylyltransferase [Firmicutes bacterium]|nr:ThiF family adenylyltransferase [Bacillota bacterium]
MDSQFSRTETLIGKNGVEKLARAKILVVGLGGVGGHVTEALARAGVGRLGLCDGDTIALSNLNRQILALHSTMGIKKTDAAVMRIRDINPAIEVIPYPFYYAKDTAHLIDLAGFDYIADCIDSVQNKAELIVNAQKSSVPVISCMGAGNKLEPGGFLVADIYETSVCPLAKVMRRELKARGVERLTVVYSRETTAEITKNEKRKTKNVGGNCNRQITNCELQITDINDIVGADGNPPESVGVATERGGADANVAASTVNTPFLPPMPKGSISFVPAAAAMVLAGKVVRDILANS